MDPIISDISKIPVFFIVGRGRSGSTLLRTLFDAHPQVCIPLESRFVQYLFYYYPENTKWNRSLVIEAIEILRQGFEPLNIETETAHTLLDNYKGLLSFEIVCKIIYLSTQSVYEKNKIVLIGDKNPRYTFFIPQLIKIFPDAKFVHLVRDYRANALAVRRAAKNIGEGTSLIFALARWIYYNRQIDRFKKIIPEKFYTLRYEDLIQHPESELKILCNYIGIDFTEKMLDYEKYINKIHQTNCFNKIHSSLKKPIDISKISEWKQILTRHEIILCEAIAGKFGLKYNYQTILDLNPALSMIYRIILFPFIFIGKIRFIFKRHLYMSRIVMSGCYTIIRKFK
jgi:hypothetical protein